MSKSQIIGGSIRGDKPRWYSRAIPVKQFAESLGVEVRTARKWCQQGRLYTKRKDPAAYLDERTDGSSSWLVHPQAVRPEDRRRLEA